MSRAKYSASVRVHGHDVVRRGVPRNGGIRTYHQCQNCGETTERRAGFRAFDCNGGGS